MKRMNIIMAMGLVILLCLACLPTTANNRVNGVVVANGTFGIDNLSGVINGTLGELPIDSPEPQSEIPPTTHQDTLNSVCPSCGYQEKYPLMHFTQAQLDEMDNQITVSPKYTASDQNLLQGQNLVKGSKNLLSYMSYTPAQRSQGNCGNCWVWASNGALEIDHTVKTGINDRISIQYFNSKYNGGNASCCAGNLNMFTNWYNSDKTPIPWSNTNAKYGDYYTSCGNYSPVPLGTISTQPHYQLNSISYSTISTYSVVQATAITNIKSALNSNKAVVYLFHYGNNGWTNFFNFWDYSNETSIFDPTAYNGETRTGGHLVLIVGYDDTDPSNQYWLALNSWGAPSNRPHGLFRLKMNMPYNAGYYSSGYGPYQQHTFQILDSDFLTANFLANITSGTTAPIAVRFSDFSTGSPTAWNWSFRDVRGNNTQVWFSTVQNPDHTFGVGNYSIVLNVSNSAGFHLSPQVTFINVSGPALPPVAKFNVIIWFFDPTLLPVDFIDNSTNNPTAWNWSFTNVTGNNTQVWFSTEQNPRHTFGVGNYSIVLNASNSAGYNLSSGITFINVSAVPVVTGNDGIAIFRPASGYWYFENNLDGIVDKSFRYGGVGDQIIKGDWDGDGKDGIAIFRPASGYWYFDYNLDGIVNNSFRYGGVGDQIIKGDWQGTGRDGIAIFRPASGFWYFDYNLDGIVDNSFRYGGVGDQIIAGDWQGSGTDGIAIFRPASGYWYFDNNLDGVIDKSFRYGGSTDQIIVGKWQGTQDGIAIFRPASGYWYFDFNLDGTVDKSLRYGGSTDQIVAGDWNGDGSDGIAIFRPSTGYWYFDSNLDSLVDKSFRYGGSADQIIVGIWT